MTYKNSFNKQKCSLCRHPQQEDWDYTLWEWGAVSLGILFFFLPDGHLCFPELFAPSAPLLFNGNFGSLTLMNVLNFVGYFDLGIWGFCSAFVWVCGYFFLSLKNKNKKVGRVCITINFCLRYLRKVNQSLAGKIHEWNKCNKWMKRMQETNEINAINEWNKMK